MKGMGAEGGVTGVYADIKSQTPDWGRFCAKEVKNEEGGRATSSSIT